MQATSLRVEHFLLFFYLAQRVLNAVPAMMSNISLRSMRYHSISDGERCYLLRRIFTEQNASFSIAVGTIV